MRRFRTQWLALFGALVVMSFSLTTAFAARPTTGTDEATNFGQQVSTFVHVLLSGTSDEDEAGDDSSGDDADDECQPASDEDGASGDEDTGDETSGDETTGDETGDETTGGECDDQADEDSDSDEDSGEDSSEDESDDSTAQNHGQCVAAVAHSDDVGENGTHGWAVVLAAQVTCWLEEQSDESTDTGDQSEDSGAEDGATDESTDASTQDHPHGKSDAAHQRKLDRASGKPTWASTGSQGKGHGHGHSF